MTYEYDKKSIEKGISTHILTRRMTIIVVLATPLGNISTHILTRRMTWNFGSNHKINKFQLTSSQGGWRIITTRKCYPFHISTHILTRRMTSYSMQLSISSVFQLTSSQGGWLQSQMIMKYGIIFQLTSSQGGWQYPLLRYSALSYFNSHPHKEDDAY